ncbi:MAG TPA: ABC transporter permease [Gemmatimonadaceae bacterium]|nr:ABC transporter permease [Gemmatimonadaceae bacterium]
MLNELWSDLRYRARALFRRRNMERELDAELRFHIVRQAEEYQRAGLRPDEALRSAHAEFGGVERIKEESRDARGTRLLETAAQDLHHALRALRKSPGFTLAVVLTLALGIGACTTIFGAVDAVLLRSLPFRDLDRLMVVTVISEDCAACDNSTAGHYLALRERTRAFAALAGYGSWSGTLEGPEQAEHVDGVTVTPSFFSTLGVAPAIGRTFAMDSASPALEHEVVIGNALWRRRFASDPNIVGSTITLSGSPYTVVGVMPPGFEFPISMDLWLPLHFDAAAVNDLSSHWLRVFGRLAPGVSAGQAQRELDALSATLEETYPDQAKGWRIVSEPLSESMLHQMREFFMPLMAAALFVLLIVCANVANLLLARTSAREREIAVRCALGAGRWRLARYLLAESMILALLGAALGSLLAWWSVPLLRGSVPVSLSRFVPGWGALAMNERALAFSVLLAILSAFIFGSLPALRASRPDLATSLKEGGHGAAGSRGGRLRRTLVIAEFALALVLLVSAGLMIRSVRNLVMEDTGMRAEQQVLTMSLELPEKRYAGATRTGELYTRLRSEVGALPGVRSVSAVTTLPLSHDRNFASFNVSGRPPIPRAKAPTAVSLVVMPGYFQTLGIPLLAGRDFTAHDDSTASRVAIISETMARHFWPGEDALGQGLDLYGTRYRIIGIAADVRDQMEHAPSSTIYQPELQLGYRNLTLVVRAACPREARKCDPAPLASSIRQLIASVDRSIAITEVRTMPQVVAEYVTPWRLLMTLLGIFAALALVVAGVGVYGVMAYAVRQRTSEIGIRMALGAGRGEVVAMVMRHAMRLAVWGATFGVLGALAVTRVLASLMLYGVSPTDPVVIGGVAALLTIVTFLASWLPARRATSIDPMIALRSE